MNDDNGGRCVKIPSWMYTRHRFKAMPLRAFWKWWPRPSSWVRQPREQHGWPTRCLLHCSSWYSPSRAFIHAAAFSKWACKSSSPSAGFSGFVPPKMQTPDRLVHEAPARWSPIPTHSPTHLIPPFLPHPMLSGHKQLLTLPRTSRAPCHPRAFACDGLHYVGCSFPVLPEQASQPSGVSSVSPQSGVH